jgi:integrin beta 3
VARAAAPVAGAGQGEAPAAAAAHVRARATAPDPAEPGQRATPAARSHPMGPDPTGSDPMGSDPTRPDRMRPDAGAARVHVPGEPDDGPEPTDEEAPDGGGSARNPRSEIRRQLREQKRLRMATLIVATLVVLGALPLYFGIRAATRDPVFNTLDALGVPGWAATSVEDEVSGSRWCIIDCRLRERRAESTRTPDETAAVYERSLGDSGWRRWEVALCPDQPVPQGQHYTCWRRDEYTLDLWVREATCENDPLRNRPTVGPAEPSGQAEPSVQAPQADACAGSVVSIKVRNAIDDDRGRPQPTQDPGLTGEDPDPVFTDGPLLEETPPSN